MVAIQPSPGMTNCESGAARAVMARYCVAARRFMDMA